MKAGWLLCVVLLAAEAGAAKDGPGPDKITDQFFKAYLGHKLPAIKKLLVDANAVAGVVGVEERWFELPPFKKAWSQQQAQIGAVNVTDETATVVVDLLRLNLGPLAGVDLAVAKALEALPPPQQEKRRKPAYLKELRAVSWTYDPTQLTVTCRKVEGKWRIERTGLDGAGAAAPVAAAVEATPPSEPEAVEVGSFKVNKADLAAYPEALKIVSVEGKDLDSAFRGRVVAVVRNQGKLALRGFSATVVYQSASGDKRALDPRRSFVAANVVICPGATVQTETEAMAPAGREGAGDKLSLHDLVVEIDRPDAFGRLLSASCGGG
jgi:hypothetical protein